MRRSLLIVLAVVACGCGAEDYPLAPVSGTVTLDGAPVADARVGFEPVRKGERREAGPGSYGKTDQQGRYRLKSLHGDDGAVIGRHVVLISTFEDKYYPDGRLEVISEERIPERYRVNPLLEFTVPAEGTDQADFELTSN